MRWLRFIALIIFIFVTGYAIPFSVKSPSFSNLLFTGIFLLITVWIAAGYFKKK